jgi:selenoprotein W-related protein
MAVEMESARCTDVAWLHYAKHNALPSAIRVSELHSKTMAVKHPRVEIEYCTQCRWLLRAAWMAQELLTTFQDEIGELVLRPGTGGVFEVRIEEDTVWSRAAQGRFPEMKDLKQLVRDRIAPSRDLGHSDR